MTNLEWWFIRKIKVTKKMGYVISVEKRQRDSRENI